MNTYQKMRNGALVNYETISNGQTCKQSPRGEAKEQNTLKEEN